MNLNNKSNGRYVILSTSLGLYGQASLTFSHRAVVSTTNSKRNAGAALALAFMGEKRLS